MKISCGGWHKALGHQNFRHLNILLKINNISFKQTEYFCRSCVQGKQCREPFKVNEGRAKDLGDLIHIDLCGPMEEPSLSNSLYLF